LRSILPLEDARGVSEQLVGEFRMTNLDGTTSVGRYVISDKLAVVSDLLTRAVADESTRNGHTVTNADSGQTDCNLIIKGKVNTFWAAPTDLVEGHTIPGYDFQSAVQIDTWVRSPSDSIASEGRRYSGYAAANYNGPPSFEAIGRLLDDAVLRMLRSFTNDAVFLDRVETHMSEE
jgi:hypothetical protein